jgi:glutamate-1-semialdehyde aminotransferase
LLGIAEELEIELAVTGVRSLFQVHFGVPGIKNMRDKQKVDSEAGKLFAQGLLCNGIYAGARPLFLSTAHRTEDVDRVLGVAATVLEKIKREGE